MSNPKWLLYGQMPVRSRFINFIDYLKNSNTELNDDLKYPVKKAGRPSKKVAGSSCLKRLVK